ncbi:MAG TPA: (5-formylfuran-3-yl)methyl phosphate synthase [Methylotenera sp.]|nr:(5-formylfuran-3-yl)methyl phosphate synthase [Methylotenera sp.]
MTQLLISVKNLEEAKLAFAAGVDIIDLKNPNEGALGALDLTVTREIVQQVNGQVVVSATVGELHANIEALVADIQLRADVGIDIVKIAVSSLFMQDHFFDAISLLTKKDIKLVAVFFADDATDLDILPKLKNAGFYGAMLDTRDKRKNLLQVQSVQVLHSFTQQCKYSQLKSGMAGSLQPQHIDLLKELNLTYLGFRGGVCENAQRKSNLNDSKMRQVINMLRNGNKNSEKARLILG